jgi:hypothetical protein
MRTAHTVVAENMGRDGEKCCKRLIAFGAKRLAILRAAIAHKILFKNMIAVHSPFSSVNSSSQLTEFTRLLFDPNDSNIPATELLTLTTTIFNNDI